MDATACHYNPNANEADGSCAEGFSLNLSDTTVCAGDTLTLFVDNHIPRHPSVRTGSGQQ